MKITAINGKEYNLIGYAKVYGEILEKNNKYYYFCRPAFRMMPISKAKIATLDIKEVA